MSFSGYWKYDVLDLSQWLTRNTTLQKSSFYKSISISLSIINSIFTASVFEDYEDMLLEEAVYNRLPQGHFSQKDIPIVS